MQGDEANVAYQFGWLLWGDRPVSLPVNFMVAKPKGKNNRWHNYPCLMPPDRNTTLFPSSSNVSYQSKLVSQDIFQPYSYCATICLLAECHFCWKHQFSAKIATSLTVDVKIKVDFFLMFICLLYQIASYLRQQLYPFISRSLAAPKGIVLQSLWLQNPTGSESRRCYQTLGTKAHSEAKTELK